MYIYIYIYHSSYRISNILTLNPHLLSNSSTDILILRSTPPPPNQNISGNNLAIPYDNIIGILFLHKNGETALYPYPVSSSDNLSSTNL